MCTLFVLLMNTLLVVLSLVVITSFMALLAYFYKSVRDFMQEVLLCINPQSTVLEDWFLNETGCNDSNNRHVRINSTVETRTIDDNSVDSEKQAYEPNWSQSWSAQNHPQSPVTRSMVTNVFTRTKVDGRNRIAVSSYDLAGGHREAPPSINGESTREMVVIPPMVAVNLDPVVLSRGYRIVESREINIMESSMLAGVAERQALRSVDTPSNTKTLTITSIPPHQASPAFLAVCQEIDQYLTTFTTSVPSSASVASGALMCAAAQPVTTSSSSDSSIVAKSMMEVPLVVDAFATAVTPSVLSPMRCIRYNSTTLMMASKSNDSTIETTTSSLRSPPTMMTPSNEKMFAEAELLLQYSEHTSGGHRMEPACSPEHSTDTIYDHL